MAGTIQLSLTQQLDQFGEPLSGGQLYIIQAGTVATPQNPYQDTGLSSPLPNPITLDAAGRVPQFFLADGQIKVRLQDQFGVVKFTADNILVIGPSGGSGGGGGSVDPTTVMQTGDIKIRYDVAIISGFVRLNGKTIGSASSGATELADPSAQALFNYLWVKDTTLVVTPGGRGASAAADWAANKQLTLPDGRNRLLMALADMGNSDIGYLANNTFTKGNQITLGSMLGAARLQLSQTQLPNHAHNIYFYDPGHTHGVSGGIYGSTALNLNYYQGGGQGGNGAGITINAAGTGCFIGSSYGVNNSTTTAAGSGAAFDSANPILLITVYMKL
jgi:hypothetical protein